MPPLDLLPRHLELLKKLLAVHVPQAEVWAFGSRVNGTAHEGSDLDLVLRNTTDLSARVEGCDDLRDAIQNSTLPMLVDVHDWSLLPAAFHDEILRGYEIIKT